MRTLLVLLITVLLSPVFAQYLVINSLTITPSNPGPYDNVGIICQSAHASGPCLLNNVQVNWVGNHATINAWHYPGMLTYICNSTDTTWLGVIGEGFFKVSYILSDQFPSGPVYSVTDSLQFSIITTGTDPASEIPLRITPNPARDYINIPDIAASTGSDIRIYDLCGRQVISRPIPTGSTKLDIRSLSPGMYILQLQLPKGSVTRKFQVSR